MRWATWRLCGGLASVGVDTAQRCSHAEGRPSPTPYTAAVTFYTTTHSTACLCWFVQGQGTRAREFILFAALLLRLLGAEARSGRWHPAAGAPIAECAARPSGHASVSGCVCCYDDLFMPAFHSSFVLERGG